MKAETLLAELRARLDIVEIISDYIELRRAGQNYKGLCPFHSEKTPSFMVSTDKQIFHCFGCGVGGNIVNFVMKYENLSFQESLRLLAKKAGLNIKEYKFEGKNEDLKEKLTEIHREALRVFVENLKRSKAAYAYLSGRGLTEEGVRTFSLGYALKEWHHLSNYLKNKGFPNPITLQTGIVSSGSKGVYDTFRDRIIFPIFDLQGDIVAFGGRVMDDSEPKYLNSPDTLLFKKGETLYGLNLAKEGIRKKDYAIIVEGYFDVIACHQYGFNNAVAPLGTALTSGHLHRLKRFTKNVLLIFDGDDAGKSAARRSVPILFEHGFASRILLLPDGYDPDTFLRKNSGVAFGDLLSKAISPVGFILNVSKKDRRDTVHEALEAISVTRDMILKEDLIRELSEKATVRETVIREELRRLSKKTDSKIKSRADAEAFYYDEELLLLSSALAFPGRLDEILHLVPSVEFRNLMVRNILERLSITNGRLDSAMISLSNEENMLITRLTLNPGFDLENADKIIEDCIKKIVMKRFNERLRQAEVTGDIKLLNSLLMERHRLIKEAR